MRSFDEKHLIERTTDGYQLTELGRAAQEHVHRCNRTVRAAVRLEPLLEAFADAAVDFDPELFVDATITEPRPDDPSPPVNRYLELFRDADHVRTLDRTSFVPPLYVEEIFELSLEEDRTGMAIYPESVVERRLTEYPDIHRRATTQTDGPIYRICDDVQFGMTIYDTERVALRAYDDETGALVLFADTDAPDALEWAEDVWDTYQERSDPPSVIDEPPEWLSEPAE